MAPREVYRYLVHNSLPDEPPSSPLCWYLALGNLNYLEQANEKEEMSTLDALGDAGVIICKSLRAVYWAHLSLLEISGKPMQPPFSRRLLWVCDEHLTA